MCQNCYWKSNHVKTLRVNRFRGFATNCVHKDRLERAKGMCHKCNKFDLRKKYKEKIKGQSNTKFLHLTRGFKAKNICNSCYSKFQDCKNLLRNVSIKIESMQRKACVICVMKQREDQRNIYYAKK
jgi:hypothetical protein